MTIPKFKTDKETAIFWDSHSFEDYFEDTKEAEIEFARTYKKTLNSSEIFHYKEKIISRKENPHEKIY